MCACYCLESPFAVPDGLQMPENYTSSVGSFSPLRRSKILRVM